MPAKMDKYEAQEINVDTLKLLNDYWVWNQRKQYSSASEVGLLCRYAAFWAFNTFLINRYHQPKQNSVSKLALRGPATRDACTE